MSHSEMRVIYVHDLSPATRKDVGRYPRTDNGRACGCKEGLNYGLVACQYHIGYDAALKAEGPTKIRWRVGRSVGRTIYLQTGTEPSEHDPLIGVMDTADLAETVVKAVNVVRGGEEVAMSGCGGCRGQGAHKRWCSQMVGPVAHVLGTQGERLADVADRIGPLDVELSNEARTLGHALLARADAVRSGRHSEPPE